MKRLSPLCARLVENDTGIQFLLTIFHALVTLREERGGISRFGHKQRDIMSEDNGSKTTVEQLTANFVAQVRIATANEEHERMAAFAAEFVRQSALRPVPQPIAPPSIAPVPGVAAKPLSHGKLLHPHCDYPGCNKPHCGPKFRWLCRDHRGDWKAVRKLRRQAERQAARAAA